MSSSDSEDDDVIVLATMLILNNDAKTGSKSKRRRLDTDVDEDHLDLPNPLPSNTDSSSTVHPDPSRTRSSPSNERSSVVPSGPSNQDRFVVHPRSSSRHVGKIPIRRLGPRLVSGGKVDLVPGNLVTVRPRSHKRKYVVHQHNQDKNAVLAKLYPQLCDYEEKFFNFSGMSRNLFEELLSLVYQSIRKVDTNSKNKSIWPRERLLLTLRLLVSGETPRSIHQQFQLGSSTVQKIAFEVCGALWEQLKVRELPKLTKAALCGIAQKFWAKWKYPHCLGAIDAKRIQIKCPENSGSQYYNSFIVLQGIADAYGNFIAVDVGGDGTDPDIDVLKQSYFGRALYGNNLPIPEPDTQLDGDIHLNEPLPYVFVGDVGYPLLKCLMRPYPDKEMDNSRQMYNVRHSHALRSVDSAFSMMTAKWTILKGCMQMNFGNATKVALACCVLHNFVRRRECTKEDPDEVQAPLKNFERYNWLYDKDQPNLTGTPCQEAIQFRDKIAQLFTSSLSMQGQDAAANVQSLLPATTDTTLTTVPSDVAIHSATNNTSLTFTTVPLDGAVQSTTKNSSLTTVPSDGAVQSTTKNSSFTTVPSDGAVQSTTKISSLTTVPLDGAVQSTTKNSSLTTVPSDGAVQSTTKNSSFTTVPSDGAVQSTTKNSSFTTVPSDGTVHSETKNTPFTLTAVPSGGAIHSETKNAPLTLTTVPSGVAVHSTTKNAPLTLTTVPSGVAVHSMTKNTPLTLTIVPSGGAVHSTTKSTPLTLIAVPSGGAVHSTTKNTPLTLTTAPSGGAVHSATNNTPLTLTTVPSGGAVQSTTNNTCTSFTFTYVPSGGTVYSSKNDKPITIVLSDDAVQSAATDKTDPSVIFLPSDGADPSAATDTSVVLVPSDDAVHSGTTDTSLIIVPSDNEIHSATNEVPLIIVPSGGAVYH